MSMMLGSRHRFWGARNAAVPLLFMARSWVHGKFNIDAKMGKKSYIRL